MTIDRRLVSAWVALAVLVIAGLMFGAPAVFLLLWWALPVFTVGYVIYLTFGWWWGWGSRVVVEGTFLTKRGRRGEMLGQIDLSSPFEASYEFHDAQVALYKVVQSGRTLRLAVPLKDDGHVVKEALRLPWPPQSTSLWWI